MIEVRIRHLRKQDAERLSKLANNKKIWDNLRDYMPFPYTLEDAFGFIDFVSKDEKNNAFAICVGDELVGIMGYNIQSDIYRESAEIGYWIGEEYWGKGITSKALTLAVDHAFQKSDVRRLFTAVFEGNDASMKVLEKAGFKKEGRARKSIIKNGIYLDEIKFGLLNPKYFSEEDSD